MNFLRSVWPTPFKIEKGKIGSFIIQLVILIDNCHSILAFIFNKVTI